MIHTDFSSIFSKMNFSSGMSAFRYAPGTPKMTTSLPYCASIMSPVIGDSRDMVNEDAYYLGM